MTLRTDTVVVGEEVIVVVVSHHLDIKFNVDAMKVFTFALTHSRIASFLGPFSYWTIKRCAKKMTVSVDLSIKSRCLHLDC